MSSPGPAALTVSELTAVIRGAMAAEPRLEDVLVEGEVSNIRMPPSGHLYFTLRDARASVRCVCWRSSVQRIPFHPENGLTVVAHGRVDIYEGDGNYQLYVDRLDPAGIGALALAVEQTAKRLRAAGLFDPAHKRPLPPLPGRVAVVTSPTGAAVRDVLNVLRRRAPQVGILVVPTPVQGEGADIAIAQAIDAAGRARGVDTVLLVRGGGSYEDLFSFQSEPVCRAIRACRRPVVTGVGHETDTTLADHAADRRAPTPSAAAELAVPDTAALAEELDKRRVRLRAGLRQEMVAKRNALERIRVRLERVSPSARLPQLRQALDGRTARLRAALLRELAAKRRRLDAITARLERTAPGRRIPTEREGLRRRRERLEAALRRDLAARRAAVGVAGGRLEALSPRRVLERGYSLTLDAAGAVVDDAARLAPGALIETLLRRGRLRSRVSDVEAAAGDGDGASTPRDERMYDDPTSGDPLPGLRQRKDMTDVSDDIAAMRYEQALAELDALIGRLEGGTVDLDEAIAYYERGSRLAQRCAELLDLTEQRVMQLVVGSGSTTQERPFVAEGASPPPAQAPQSQPRARAASPQQPPPAPSQPPPPAPAPPGGLLPGFVPPARPRSEPEFDLDDIPF